MAIDLGLMTRDEVVVALRMDHLKDPTSALYLLRKRGLLTAVDMGRRALLYRREDVERLAREGAVAS